MRNVSFLILIIANIKSILSYFLNEFLSPSKFINEEISLPKINSILYLTPNTLKEVFLKYEKIFILFYAPWNEESENIIKIFKNILNIDKQNFTFGMINSYYYKSLLEEYEIEYYPTLFYFNNYGKNKQKYDGKISKELFLDFLNSKFEKRIIEIKSIEEIKKNFENKNYISYIYFGNDENEIKIFEKKAKQEKQNLFGILKDESLIKLYSAKPNSIAIFTNFNEKINFNQGKINDSTFDNLYDLHYFPYLMKGNEGLFLLTNKKKSVFFINLNFNKSDNEKFENYFYNLGKKYRKDKIYFCIYNEKKNFRLVDYINFPLNNLNPKITLINYQNGNYKKFYFNETFKEETFENFINDYLNNKFKLKIKSQKINKENENKLIKIIVGDNFEKEVKNNTKDVLVKFYNPYSSITERIKKVYEELGKKLEKIKNNFTIAEFNAIDNELYDERLYELPFIRLYKKEKGKIKKYICGINDNLEYLINFIIIKCKDKYYYDGEYFRLNETFYEI